MTHISGNSAPCRLLVTEPADGIWNMAVDEALLDEVAQTGSPVLRFYTWRRPTLSLGYFQSSADRSQHPASAEADVVRRLSGGGAILHDNELTYSWILPASHSLAQDTQALYQFVHQRIAATLNALLSEVGSRWEASLCPTTEKRAAADEPFLCFQRRSEGDILLSEIDATPDSPTHKIVGSAQRRRRGTVLQHGSILTSRSDFAPELPGIADLAHSESIAARLFDSVRTSFCESLDIELAEYELTEHLLKKAEQLACDKYQANSWTKRR